MARVCEITGKRPQVGNNVSHANNKSKRKFYPNLQTKRFFIPEDGRWITIKVSAKALKTINSRGIYAVLKEAREKGVLSPRVIKALNSKPSTRQVSETDQLVSETV